MQFIKDREIYEKVVQELVISAEHFVWIASADIKDMYVKRGNGMQPFLSVLADMIESGVSVRLIHAKEPGPNFRKDFDRYSVLAQKLERMLCPRVHFKSVIVDGKAAYMGSANLTGAGMGAKAANRRNFESDLLTKEPWLVNQIMTQFDEVWMGAHCEACARKKFCPDCPLHADD